MIPQHNMQSWGLSLNDFNVAVFGRALKQFQVPASTYKTFRKTVTETVNGATTTKEVFDSERIFENMCFTYINAVMSMYEIVRQTEFYEFEVDTREALKKTIYAAIEYACQNRQIWQNVNGSAISVPGYSMGADQTPWVIAADMLGTKATNLLTNSGLEDYEWLEHDGLYEPTLNGNTKILRLNQPIQ